MSWGFWKLTDSPERPNWSASMELRLKKHMWYGLRAVIPHSGPEVRRNRSLRRDQRVRGVGSALLKVSQTVRAAELIGQHARPAMCYAKGTEATQPRPLERHRPYSRAVGNLAADHPTASGWMSAPSSYLGAVAGLDILRGSDHGVGPAAVRAAPPSPTSGPLALAGLKGREKETLLTVLCSRLAFKTG